MVERKKTEAERWVSVQKWLIHFSNGQQCKGYRENKSSRAGVWRKFYKVYKESVFLYNNKKPKATRAVVYTKHGDIASLADRFLTRQGDETREVGTGRGERCVQRRKEGARVSSPSINLQAGAGVRRPGNAGGRAGAGAGYGGVGRRQSPECPPAQPLMPGSSGISSERVWGGDAGPAGSPGQRRKEVIAPWSLTWKTGEAGSFHSSSSPLAGPVHPTNLPTLSRCPQYPRAGT